MKRNQCFNILNIQHFKGSIPKFEPSLKSNGEFITPGSLAILLSEVFFESGGQMSGHVF